MSCIYFLIKDDKIIYIGQTKNLKTRLKVHAKKGFDSVRSIECDDSVILYYEQRWIRRFKPPLNGSLGRPEIEDKKYNVPLRLRVSLHNKLKDMSRESNKPVSYFLHKAIEEVYS